MHGHGEPLSRQTTVAGVFFYNFSTFGKKFPVLFSYRKNIVLPYVGSFASASLPNFNAYQANDETVSIDDVRVLGDDGIQFSLGYVIAVRVRFVAL